MNDRCFVDTNVLVYFRDDTEPDKQQAASEWLAFLWRERNGRISYQVLQEYYITVTQKLKPGLPKQEAREEIRAMTKWQPLSVSESLMEAAWVVQDRYHFSWWDSLIVSAAQLLECEYLLTEDLQDDQEIEGVTVINPFSRTVGQVFIT